MIATVAMVAAVAMIARIAMTTTMIVKMMLGAMMTAVKVG